MRLRYRPVAPSRGETVSAVVAALGAAAAVGLATFYLTRMLLAREPLVQPKPPPGEDGSGGRGDGGA